MPGGCIRSNVAHSDGLRKYEIGPIEILDPSIPGDREILIDALAQAEEIATAVPSVANYTSPGPGSIHRLLAQGLVRKARRHGPNCVTYVAENNNRAAEILEEAVATAIPEDARDTVVSRGRFIDTVIGKMSGIIPEPDEIAEWNLSTITPDLQRAFLVEAFNRILISRIDFGEARFIRGITAFEEKDDLLPFCEAKLYGHNATHALAGYIGGILGIERISQLEQVPGAIGFLRSAFIEESGGALIEKYNGLDHLFTAEGYREYVDDLIVRMTNPWLKDSVERVTRETKRKLGWNDRLIGTMRLALTHGITPERYAFGAAAALTALDESVLSNPGSCAAILGALWSPDGPPREEKRKVTDLITPSLVALNAWRKAGCPDIEKFLTKPV